MIMNPGVGIDLISAGSRSACVNSGSASGTGCALGTGSALAGPAAWMLVGTARPSTTTLLPTFEPKFPRYVGD